MIVGVDTDVLVNWVMSGAPHHAAARRFVEEMVDNDDELGIAAQTIHELVHICTDARRFENPLTMAQAIGYSRSLWDGGGVVRVAPTPTVLHRTLDLLSTLKLGRKRILDTAFAATLEASGIEVLATFNAKHFEIFSFLEVIVPDGGTSSR